MIKFSGASNYILRDNTWLSPGQDFTIAFFAKQGSGTPGGGQFRIYYQYGDNAGANPYIYFGSQTGGNDLGVELFDGTNYLDSIYTPLVAGQKKYAALVYTAASHALQFYYNGALIDTLTSNLSTYVFVQRNDICGGSPFNDHSVGYLIQAQRAYSLAELNAQAASITAVSATSLLSYCPLQTGIDLTSHNNTPRQFAGFGTVTTDTDDPLISVLAGPPTNTTPGTAMIVTTDSAVFVDTLAAGVAAPVTWFVVTCPAGVRELGACARRLSGSFSATLNVYEGLTNALSDTPIDGMSQAALGVPMQFPTTAGLSYYLRATRNGAFSPATLLVSVIKAPDLPVPRGSILINDSTPGLPIIAISSVDGSVLSFGGVFPAGESNRVLTNGTVAIDDNFVADNPLIYDSSWPPVAVLTPTMPAAGYEFLGTDQTTGWWAMKPNSGITHAIIVFIAKDGTVSGTTYDLGAASPGSQALTPNLANTVVYFIQNTSNVNKPVQQITIPGGVVSVFIPAQATLLLHHGLITMLDDSLLVPYSNAGNTINVVRRFDSAGVQQGSDFDLGSGNGVEELFTAIDDPNSFWAWTESGVTNRFRNLKVSDGSVLTDITSPQFIGGVYQDSSADFYNFRFGTDFSCVPWVLRTTPVPPTVVRDPIRRLRCFPLPFDRNFWIYIRRAELLIEAGTGNANPPGDDPQLEVRFSGDGGLTWGDTILVPMGKQGERNLRQVINNVGKLRNGWVEVVDSDPVRSDLLAFYVDAEENES